VFAKSDWKQLVSKLFLIFVRLNAIRKVASVRSNVHQVFFETERVKLLFSFLYSSGSSLSYHKTISIYPLLFTSFNKMSQVYTSITDGFLNVFSTKNKIVLFDHQRAEIPKQKDISTIY